jgi:hypothetical protein
MIVFHAVMVCDHGGPRETHDLGLFVNWSVARDQIEDTILDEWPNITKAEVGPPDITVNEEGMVSHARWDVDGTTFHVTRREVKCEVK